MSQEVTEAHPHGGDPVAPAETDTVTEGTDEGAIGKRKRPEFPEINIDNAKKTMQCAQACIKELDVLIREVDKNLGKCNDALTNINFGLTLTTLMSTESVKHQFEARKEIRAKLEDAVRSAESKYPPDSEKGNNLVRKKIDEAKQKLEIAHADPTLNYTLAEFSEHLHTLLGRAQDTKTYQPNTIASKKTICLNAALDVKRYVKEEMQSTGETEKEKQDLLDFIASIEAELYTVKSQRMRNARTRLHLKPEEQAREYIQEMLKYLQVVKEHDKEPLRTKGTLEIEDGKRKWKNRDFTTKGKSLENIRRIGRRQLDAGLDLKPHLKLEDPDEKKLHEILVETEAGRDKRKSTKSRSSKGDQGQLEADKEPEKGDKAE